VWDVCVTNPDGTSDCAAGALTVDPGYTGLSLQLSIAAAAVPNDEPTRVARDADGEEVPFDPDAETLESLTSNRPADESIPWAKLPTPFEVDMALLDWQLEDEAGELADSILQDVDLA
jgi:hypothetical protein